MDAIVQALRIQFREADSAGTGFFFCFCYLFFFGYLSRSFLVFRFVLSNIEWKTHFK